MSWFRVSLVIPGKIMETVSGIVVVLVVLMVRKACGC